MATNPDSIVEALQTVLGNSHVEGIHNSDGEWIQAGIVIEVDDARRMREEAIPAVESLVAENARLRAALRRYMLHEETFGYEKLAEEFGPEECPGTSWSMEAWMDRVLRDPARRALKGDD